MKPYKNREIRVNGRHGCIACIQVSDYGDRIIANADEDKITEFQMGKALRKEYPHFTFQSVSGRGDGIFMEGELGGGIRSVMTS